MNQNINYIGMVNLLRHLQNAGLVSRSEARRAAARLRVETGADVIFSPRFLLRLDMDILRKYWYCVLLTGGDFVDGQKKTSGSLALNSTPRVITIAPSTPVRDRKLRVAAYAWVSSSSEDQLNSFAAQNAHYTELITANPEWEFVDVYADKGITGTSAEKRDDFQRLLADCRRDRVDKILVKSSSRFARNAKECLKAIRELKALGVGVRLRGTGYRHL